MEQVEALYKSNPEYFIYYKIRPAINAYNKKLLYTAFPETMGTKIFDSFTKRSFQEIQKNLQTHKYPILFTSFTLYLINTVKLPKETFDEWHQILNQVDRTSVTPKESRIAKYLLQRYEQILALKQIL